MAKSSDQVFQLSLTEIAFTIAFILLLLLGWMVFKSEHDKKELEATIAEIGDTKATLIALDEAKKALSETLSRVGAAKPEEVISELVSQKMLIQEREALRKRIEELDAQVSTLSEIREIIAKASGQDANPVIKRQIESALALQTTLQKQLEEHIANDGMGAKNPDSKPNVAKEATAAVALKAAIEKQLGNDIEKGKEAQVAKELVDASKQLQNIVKTSGSPESVKKENADLRGQVAFLKGKLEARGGRDYPPCWAEENTGKVEFLFTIEIHSDGLRITPSWTSKREADGRALPGVDQLLAPNRHSLEEFNVRMQGIDRLSKANNCRHYVQLRNHVNQLDVFNRYRYGIENFFYKLELRS